MKKKGMAMTSRAHTIKLDLRLDLTSASQGMQGELISILISTSTSLILSPTTSISSSSSTKPSILTSANSRPLTIGIERVPLGQEVAALKKVGVVNFLGVDLVPYPLVVIKGDFHKKPFESNSFDFEFSNVFDHALYRDKFVGEIERTLKPGGVAVIHVASSTSTPPPLVESSTSILPPPLLSCAS